MGWSYIAAPAKLSIPFLLDEKSTVVPVRLAGEQSGGKRKVSYGDARSNSERAAPSACVGRRLSAPQIVWNRSTRRAGARRGGYSGMAVSSARFTYARTTSVAVRAAHRSLVTGHSR